ncbi:MAG: hypothetical protein EOM20_21960, partial [Spartobacteria bacterium]|nr:hypothetical protein [Spartobacteria bacterium]
DDLGSALSTYFFYEQHAYMNRSNNPAAFDQMMRDSISAGDPVVVSIPSHAILADGLSSDAQTNFFHINYGWGGINDGWYMPSDINGNSLSKGVFGSKPAFLPILSAFSEATNTSGTLTNEWVFPACRLAELDRFQLAQGQYVPTNMLDAGQSYDAWTQSGAPWTNLASGGHPGACYFKQNAFASSAGAMSSGPFIPAADTVLSFDYKAQLNTDHFYVEISDDDGVTWDVLLHETSYINGYTNGWWEGSFPLGGYAGQVCLIRFRYATGSYYVGTYGVYVDNISCSHVDMLTWTVVDSNISSAASSYVVSNLADGVYYYSLAAADASGLQEAGPLVSVTVLKP